MGELILGRKDDGTLEILRADDEIELDDHLVPDLPSDGDYRLEGRVLKVDASNGFVAYVLTEHDADLHVWRLVRTADREGR